MFVSWKDRDGNAIDLALLSVRDPVKGWAYELLDQQVRETAGRAYVATASPGVIKAAINAELMSLSTSTHGAYLAAVLSVQTVDVAHSSGQVFIRMNTNARPA